MSRKIRDTVRSGRILVSDGAGTVMQSMGLRPGECLSYGARQA